VTERVAVVGCGLVGRSWAIAFARGGFRVALHDADGGAAREALAALPAALEPLAALDLLGGREPGEVLDAIEVAGRLEEAVDGASHVQENVSERVEVKRALLAELDRLCPPEAALASSTSALMPSDLARGLSRPERMLVAHPLNPPHLVPAVEVVPHPGTDPAVVEAVARRLRRAGQTPVTLARETEGFVMNRLQGALLDEAFALVAEGIASPEDVDVAMRDGLARRWALMGPFETIDLNAPGGVRDYAARYGPAYDGIGRGRPNRHRWEGPLMETVAADRAARLPEQERAGRMAWRDARLAALAGHLEAGR
jgi:3-hydroxyacyl-CoA dehydrogenase